MTLAAGSGNLKTRHRVLRIDDERLPSQLLAHDTRQGRRRQHNCRPNAEIAVHRRQQRRFHQLSRESLQLLANLSQYVEHCRESRPYCGQLPAAICIGLLPSTSSSFYLLKLLPLRAMACSAPAADQNGRATTHTPARARDAHARVATVCPAVCATHRRSSRCPAAQHCARPIRASRGPTRHPCAGVYAIALPSRRRTSTHWVAAAGVEKARQVPARPGSGVKARDSPAIAVGHATDSRAAACAMYGLI